MGLTLCVKQGHQDFARNEYISWSPTYNLLQLILTLDSCYPYVVRGFGTLTVKQKVLQLLIDCWRSCQEFVAVSLRPTFSVDFCSIGVDGSCLQWSVFQ